MRDITWPAESQQRIQERFDQKVQRGEGCWMWTACRDAGGYGRIRIESSPSVMAHRVAWVLNFGSIPVGMVVCHRCDTPACVRPDHLFLGSIADNVADMFTKGRAANQAGMHNGQAKLTDDKVREIRRRYKPRSPTDGGKALAAEFDVHVTIISMVMSRKIWAHVAD